MLRQATGGQADGHARADDDAIQHGDGEGRQQQLPVGLPGTLSEKGKATDGKPFEMPDKEELHQNAEVKVGKAGGERTQSLASSSSLRLSGRVNSTSRMTGRPVNFERPHSPSTQLRTQSPNCSYSG